MINSARIAVSIPKKTLALLERARRKSKRSRSALVGEALERYLQESLGDREQRYADAYRRVPEAGDAATAAAVLDSWDDWR